MTSIRRRSILLSAGLIALAALTSPKPTPAAAAGSGTVVIHNFMFEPTSLTVEAGSTVTWSNSDNEPHTIVSDAGLFRSGALDTNDHYSFKFDKPGTYHFACSIHPQMVGTIVVR